MSKEPASLGQTRIFKHSLAKALSSENSKQLVDGHMLMTMQEKNHVNDLKNCKMEDANHGKNGKLQISGNAAKQADYGRGRQSGQNYCDPNIASPFSKTDEKLLSTGEYTHYNNANSVIFERMIKNDPHATSTLSSDLVEGEGNCKPGRRRKRSADLTESMKLPDLLQGQETCKDTFDTDLCSSEVRINECQTSQKEVVEKNTERHISVRISLNKSENYVSGLSVCSERNILPEKLSTVAQEAHRGEQNDYKSKDYKKSDFNNNSKEIMVGSKAFTRRNSDDLYGSFEEISENPGVMQTTKKVSMLSNDSEQYVKTSTCWWRENKPYMKNRSTDYNSYSNSNSWSRENKPCMKNRSTDYNSYGSSNWSKENKPCMKNRSTDYNRYGNSNRSRENKPCMKNRSTDYNSYGNSNWSRENRPYMKNRSADYNSYSNSNNYQKNNRLTSFRHDFKFNKNNEQSTHSNKIDKSNNSQKVVTRCKRTLPLVHQNSQESQKYLIPNSKDKDRVINGSSNTMITQKVQDQEVSGGALIGEVLDKTVASSRECEVVSDDECKNITLNVKNCCNEHFVENKAKHRENDKDLHRVNCLISDIFKSYKSEDMPNKLNKIKTMSNELPISNSLHANKRSVEDKDESPLKEESNNQEGALNICSEADSQTETLAGHDSKDSLNQEGALNICSEADSQTETLAGHDSKDSLNQEGALNICSEADSQTETLAGHDSKDSLNPEVLNMQPQDTCCEEKMQISTSMQNKVQPAYSYSGEDIQYQTREYFGEDDTCLPAQVDNEFQPSLTTKKYTISSVEMEKEMEKTSNVNLIAQSKNTSDKLCSKSSSEFNSCSSEPNSDYEAEICSQSDCEERPTPKQVAPPDLRYYAPAYPYNPIYGPQNRDWPLHINDLHQGSAHPYYVSNVENQDKHSPLLLRKLCLPASSFSTQESLEKINKFIKSCSINIEDIVRNVSDNHTSLDAYVTVSIPDPSSCEFYSSDKGSPATAPFNPSTPATITSALPPYFQPGFWPSYYAHHLDTSVRYPFGYYDHSSRVTNPSFTQQAPFNNYEYPVPKLDMRDEGFNMWMYSHCAPLETGHYEPHRFDHNSKPQRLVSSGKYKMTTEVETQDMIMSDANVTKVESHLPQDMNQVHQSVDYIAAKNDACEGLKEQGRSHSLTDMFFDLNESGNSRADLNDSGSEPLSPPVSVLTPKKSEKSKGSKFHPYSISNFLTPERLTNDWTQKSSQFHDPLARNPYQGGSLTASDGSEYAQVNSKNTVQSWSEHKKYVGLQGRNGTQSIEANSLNKTSVQSSSKNPDSSHGGTWYSKQFHNMAASKLPKLKNSDSLNWRERGEPLNASPNWRDHWELLSSSEHYQKRRWSLPLSNMPTVGSTIIKNGSGMDKSNQQALCSEDSTLTSCCYSETNDLHKEIESCYEQTLPKELGVLDRSFLLQQIFMSRCADPNASQMSKFNEVIKDSAWATDFARRSKLYAHKFIDSHCHIDFLYKQLGLKDVSYKKFKEDHSNFFPANYEGCIAVFCNPRTFYAENPKDNIVKLLTDEGGVWFAFGCHPKNAQEFTELHEIGLRRFLRHPKVVALGEIGLDYSGMFKQHADVQKNVFRKQLVLALEMNLPLVIHCRDADEDCLEILTEIVPRSHKIHAHCFTRDIHVAWRWLAPFPNLFLGLTPLITYLSAREAANTAQHIPLDRLLLETDAPYFVPRTSVKMLTSCSYPGLALCTAEKVAEFKGIPVDAVLKACRENTTKMYGI